MTFRLWRCLSVLTSPFPRIFSLSNPPKHPNCIGINELVTTIFYELKCVAPLYTLEIKKKSKKGGGGWFFLKDGVPNTDCITKVKSLRHFTFDIVLTRNIQDGSIYCKDCLQYHQI